ncbi:MAG TPA: MltA domain-containing protein [Burkholderiaceae bacterium]|nr:MltA domain-containing protein [Burkholderiaceae bacterium]
MQLFLKAVLAAAILVAQAGCSNPPPLEPRGAPPGAPAAPAINLLDIPLVNPTIVRARARWVPVDWAALPGFEADRLSEWWPALLRGCERPAFDWVALCEQARAAATPAFSDEAARAWLRQRLQPYRVESLGGEPDGLLTGYFEPLVEARRTPQGAFRVPLYGPPADLAARKPYWTRQEIDSLPAAQKSLRGRALAFVADPLDALILQIQGSGRLAIAEARGRRTIVRVAFAGHNDQAYQSVGRWLIDQGELTATQASWPGIKAWARAHPKRLNEMLWANPRVVFFREEALPDPQAGPVGGQGAPLTPGRSVAVDTLSIPYGTPVWLDSTEPLSSTPLRRLAMAQDTGSAITGAVRADYFWGWGDAAENQAGRMKQPLRLWVLWPRP